MTEKWYNLYNLEPQFKNFLIAENFSPISLKNYLSDFRYFVGWLNNNIKYQIHYLKDKIKNKDLQNLSIFLTLIDLDFLNLYKKYLLENNTPLKTINRRLSTIRKFFSFCISQGWLKENPAKKVSNISHLQTKNYEPRTNNKASESHNIISNIKPRPSRRAVSNIFSKFKNLFAYKSKQNNNTFVSIQYYIGLIIILIFVATLGAGIYNQFFNKSEKTFAYPLAPTTRAGRILSFQGRLTDTLGNPITTATNVTFRLYNTPTGGTALYTAGACAITPNQDGIFNVLIGGSGYTPTPPQEVCGTEIPASIFTENANIYMGITVASDAEMTPRQQIANVGYAINAETLQGLPPGINTSTIPYINQDGNLLIAASTPGIRSTFSSADFTLSSAKATIIQSAGTGDIILQATESGTLKVRTGGNSDVYNRLIIDNNGLVGIGLTPSQNLEVAGNIYANSGQIRLGNFASAPTSIGSGSVYYNSTNNKIYYYNGSNWEELSSGFNWWKENLGLLYPVNSTLDLAIGGTATSSAKFAFTNINSGTPTFKMNQASSIDLPNSTVNALNIESDLMSFDTQNNRVGIGTTTPLTKLDIYQPGLTGWAGRIISRNQNIASMIGVYNNVAVVGAHNANLTEWRPIYINTDDSLTSFGNVIIGGNVGIGTTSPAAKLDVSGSIFASQKVKTDYFTDYNNENYGLDPASITNFGGYSLKITGGALLAVDTGNVGIGTTPSHKLSIAGGYQTTGLSGAANQIHIGASGTSPNAAQIVWGDNSGWKLNFGTRVSGTFTERMTILDTGNVGIGTTAPNYKLEVRGNAYFGAENSAVVIDDGTNKRIGFVKQVGKFTYLTAASGGPIVLAHSSATDLTDNVGTQTLTERLYINPSGNVGIGTTEPTFNAIATPRLVVSDGTDKIALGFQDGTPRIGFEDTASSIRYYIDNNAGLFRIFHHNGTGFSSVRFAITSSGNVGIGTTNPNRKLQVNGTIYVSGNDAVWTTSNWGKRIELSNGGIIQWLKGSGTISRGIGLTTDDTFYFIRSTADDNSSSPIYDMVINGNGNVGIGTTSPENSSEWNRVLDVYGDTHSRIITRTSSIRTAFTSHNSGFYSAPAGGILGTETNHPLSFITNSTTKMTINSSGNVGIGTTTPSHKLSIAGGYQTTGLSGAANQLHIGASGTSPNAAQIVWGDNTGWKLNFGTRVSGTFTERMTILDTGNVGIGTTSPQVNLEINSTTGSGGYVTPLHVFAPSLSTGSNVQMRLGVAASNYNSGEVRFYYAGSGSTSNRMELGLYGIASVFSILGNGNVGIGTSQPSQKFHVRHGDTNIVFNIDNTIADKVVIEAFNDGNTQKRDILFNPWGGNVGIGTTTPAYRLELPNIANSSGQGRANSWVTYSDIRFKTNVKTLENALDKVKNLRGVSFDWKDQGVHDIGFIAQEVEKVIPEIVQTDPNGYKSLDYGRITPLLVESIKQQQNQIDDFNKTLSLNSSGDVIIENTSEEYVYDGNLDIANQIRQLADKSQNYNLKLKTGEIIDRIGAFAEIVVGKIKSGLIEAENTIVNNALIAKTIVAENINLTTETITIAGKKLADYIDERINQVLNSQKLLSSSEKIISPVVETEQINFQNQNAKIKTEMENSKLEIVDYQNKIVAEFNTDEKETSLFGTLEVNSNQEKGKLAQVILKNLEGKSTVVIDASGNASFSGQVTVSSLVSDVGNLGNLIAKEASVEGKLVAKEVEAENIDNLTKTVFEQRQSLSETTNTINEIQRLLAQIQNKPLPDVSNQTNLSNTTDFNQFQPVSTSFNDLTVTGSSNLYNVSVSGSILAGQLFIENNSIVSLGQELKLSALSKINLFDGAVTIAKDGTITTKGILIAEAGIKTDTIAPQSEDNLNILGNLNVLGNLSLPKATDSAIIAASDNFAKNGIFAPAIETATASAGFGILPKNSSEVIIYNDNVREYSLVYLTPTTNNNSQLSVIEKKYCDSQTTENCKPYFKVVTSLPENQDIKFDWLIIN